MRNKNIQFHGRSPCPTCGGLRLRKEALAVTIDDKNIIEVSSWPVKLLTWIDDLAGGESFSPQREALIAERVLREIKNRLGFLVNVGLDYLALQRSAGSLSGGEAQRIHLATQIGSRLMGVLYVLDEPPSAYITGQRPLIGYTGKR